MISFSLNNKEAQRVLSNIKNGFSDFKEPLRKVKGMQLKEIDGQYKSEGKKITAKWKPLKPSTIKDRLAKGFPAGPILTRSGKMKRNTKQKKLTKNKLEIGNDTKYFQFHQLGTRKIPQRQVHGHSDKMIKKVTDIVADHIIKKAKY